MKTEFVTSEASALAAKQAAADSEVAKAGKAASRKGAQ